MMNTFLKRIFSAQSKAKKPTVCFATAVWERDWKHVLLDEQYLTKKLIANHEYPFDEKLLIINNVNDKEKVIQCANALIEKKIFTRVALAEDFANETLQFFHLEKKDFKGENQNQAFEIVRPKWVYYNALAPLSAIYLCKSDYLLYVTADVSMQKPVKWIESAIDRMQRKSVYKVANLVWNDKYDEAKKESYKTDRDFFVAKQGFSDQCFLVRREDFRQPIYHEIRKDANHYPRGDVFEKRVFSYMKNRKWKRLIYRHGSYTHENF